MTTHELVANVLNDAPTHEAAMATAKEPRVLAYFTGLPQESAIRWMLEYMTGVRKNPNEKELALKRTAANMELESERNKPDMPNTNSPFSTIFGPKTAAAFDLLLKADGDITDPVEKATKAAALGILNDVVRSSLRNEMLNRLKAVYAAISDDPSDPVVQAMQSIGRGRGGSGDGGSGESSLGFP